MLNHFDTIQPNMQQNPKFIDSLASKSKVSLINISTSYFIIPTSLDKLYIRNSQYRLIVVSSFPSSKVEK